MARTKPDDLSDENLAEALRIVQKTMKQFEIGDAVEIIDPEHRLDEIGYHIVQAADRLHRAEEAWEEVAELLNNVEEAIGGGGFADIKYQRKYLLGEIDRLQRVEEENEQMRELLKELKKDFCFIHQEVDGNGNLYEADRQARDAVKDIDTLLADLEPDAEDDA